MGRRKIEMKRLIDNNSRQVTFSKRRFGVFKKANELSTLCFVDVAIIAFSPGAKPYSFGNPSIESVIWRFLNQHSLPTDGSPQLVDSNQEARVNKLIQQLSELHNKLEAEKKHGKMLHKMKEKSQFKWDAPIDELSLHELEELKESLDELLENVKVQVSEKEAASSLLLLGKKPV